MSIIRAVLRDLCASNARRQRHSALLRYARLHAFIEQRITEDVYSEPPDEGHARITSEVLEGINSKLDLRGKHVLDVGCGRGVALEKFAQYGAIATGLAFG
jgi:2-polyprenyl-3-methyl-5-hydroxy-6-metoxy-1,4-benzoquinol methylase